MVAARLARLAAMARSIAAGDVGIRAAPPVVSAAMGHLLA